MPLAARRPANLPQPKRPRKGRSRRRRLLHPLRRDVDIRTYDIFLKPVPLAARARENLGGKAEKDIDGHSNVGRKPNGHNGLLMEQPVDGNGERAKEQNWKHAPLPMPTMTSSTCGYLLLWVF